MHDRQINVRELGLVDYDETFARMAAFTDARTGATMDEIWLLQHPPIFTLGLNGDRSHVLSSTDIPVVQVDRGGQVTYHGPGQLVVYTLLDLKRARLGIRDLVSALENAVIAVAANHGIPAEGRRDAPGVYVDGVKLASLGLRVRRGCSYHGLALNVAMDLAPFSAINPCGFSGMAVTQLRDLGVAQSVDDIQGELLEALLAELRYSIAP